MTDYHYKSCGLDNVFIRGYTAVTDDEGNRVHRIQKVNLLHKAIATAIVMLPVAMTGKELRFLRTEMGLTQSELARIVHREPLSIGRWERGEVEIDSNAEVIMRVLACEMLGLETCEGIRKMAESVIPSAETKPIVIDGSDPDHYRPLAA